MFEWPWLVMMAVLLFQLFRGLELFWERGRRVREIGKAFGLKPVPNSFVRVLPSLELAGTLSGVKVWMRVGFVSKERTLSDVATSHLRFSLTLKPQSGLKYGLYLSRENLLKRVGLLAPGSDITTGDSAFDKQLKVLGDYPAGVLSLLDSSTRKLLLSLSELADEFEVRPTELRAELVTDGSTFRLERILTLGLELVGRLQGSGTLQERLVQIAVADPLGEVRARTLSLVLSREQVTEALRQELLIPLTRDPILRIQAMAAVAAGGEVLQALCETVLRLPKPWAEPVLATLAGSSDPVILPVMRASLLQLEYPEAQVQALIRLRDVDALGTLAQCWRNSKGRVAAPLFLDGLRRLGGASLETFWIQLLEDTDRSGAEVRVAMQALAENGSTRAVLTLKRWVGLFGGERSKLAEEAIRQIQSRAVGAEAGQLMLSPLDETAGQLMLAPGEVGGLRLVEGEAGGLALAHGEAGGLQLLPPVSPPQSNLVGKKS